MNSLLLIARIGLLFAVMASPLFAEKADAANVVATVKPIHSLVAAVMAGTGEPHLIVRGGGSPHAYSLKPSDAAALRDAVIVFWVGPNLETFLAAPLQSIAVNAKIVALSTVPGVERLPMRESGTFEVHDHEDTHGEHQDAASDAHVWLDPLNAKAMVRAISGALVAVDPDQADTYRANANAMARRLDALVAEIDAELTTVRGRPFIVFHDAYHYFEHRFRIEAAASITVSPDVMPGARRLADIRDKVRATAAVCVFSEPQFEPRLIRVVTEGSLARTGTLDPLGAALTSGPDLYETLIRNLAVALKECLTSIH